MSIMSCILDSLKNIGIDIEDIKDNEADLRDYVKDSVLFISFMIELENNLGIEIPYEMLYYDKLSSLQGFSVMIEGLVADTKENITDKQI